jgi:hypothetical protein
MLLWKKRQILIQRISIKILFVSFNVILFKIWVCYDIFIYFCIKCLPKLVYQKNIGPLALLHVYLYINVFILRI